VNEAETRAELIDPALKAAGWGVVDGSRIRREVITLGRLQGQGRRGTQEIADYVLLYKNQKLAVVEAKRKSAALTEGLAQAKQYATKLQARFAFATNGLGIYQVDMKTGVEGEIERYPTPQELWRIAFQADNNWRDRFAEVPFEDKSGSWDARYYQHNAINHTMEAIADGKQRILLTLATGTGKTAIAFQIAWKLFHSRWNLKRDGQRLPRILFLADRNILANQAFNAFSAFPEDALVRVDPKSVRKKGSVPKNGSIFFTIFQTFMTGKGESGLPAPYFGEYPPDFFDFIIIDECHRGGANDESNWRDIMDYFKPAVQLGLTATPRTDKNVNTYKYFGEPVYVYSLKQGINDGYLTPFRVKQIQTTLDEYVYTSDDKVIEGEVEEGKRYLEPDFNKIIEIKEREKYRVNLFMGMIDQTQKSLVFCATQDHALAVRDLINQTKTNTNPNYCVRVTANDGDIGERFLKQFQDNEKTIPTILTTSYKLSTGVDARNIRNIILMRKIDSLIEFKQIIGRGTRLFDGKDYFTIYDFVKAYEHFSDPEWDGDPEPCETCGQLACICALQPQAPKETCKVCGQSPCICEKEQPQECEVCGERPCICNKRQKIRIKLADGKERTIQNMTATTFWSPDGKPMSAAEFIQSLYGEMPNLFKSESQLRAIWSKPDTRKALLLGLAEKGFGDEQLEEMKKLIEAEDSDIYDVLSYIAFARSPITRADRVALHRDDIMAKHESRERVFLEFVLSQYVKVGVHELDTEKLPSLIALKYHALADALKELGDPDRIRELFVGFQPILYSRESQST
jgi:type I restriction enzyme R subunit